MVTGSLSPLSWLPLLGLVMVMTSSLSLDLVAIYDTFTPVAAFQKGTKATATHATESNRN